MTREYAMGMVKLAVECSGAGWPFQWDCVNTHLVVARNELLANARADNCDVLLWVDADVRLAYESPDTMWSFLREATVDDDVAVVAAKCWLKRGELNCIEGERARDIDKAGPLPYAVECIGLGAAAFNMRWWRTVGADFRFRWLDGVGEDYGMCRWAWDHGGRVLVDPVLPTWHDGMTYVPTGPARRVLV